MRRRWGVLALGAAPGLAVAVASLAGLAPRGRDLPGYFQPLRVATARVIEGEGAPFWTEAVGCGEPYLANPETAVLYPPAWWAAVLPAAKAVGVEIGLHLALLGAGVALLALRLGATEGWAVAAAWGATLAGPVLESATVLNNLDTLAWLPWLWWAALRRTVAGTAAFMALAFLGGEPQLAVLGAVGAVVLAPRRRTAAGLALGAALVAVLAVPFVLWVLGSDRGAGLPVAEAARGGLSLGQLAAVAFPGAATTGGEFRFVTSPSVPLWGLLLALVGLRRSGGARRLAILGMLCVAAAFVASAGPGPALWTTFTRGLLRYPGRLLFPAVVLLMPAAAATGARISWRARWGVATGVLAAAGGVALGGALPAALVQATGAGAAVTAPLGAPVAALAALALGRWTVPVLRPRRAEESELLCAGAQEGARRVWAVEPSIATMAWVGRDPETRARALGLGYQPLEDGRRIVRTFAPVTSRALATQLAEADRGPAGRWWLDALGANLLVSPHPLSGFPEVCMQAGLRAYLNPAAWPLVAVAAGLPRPGEALESAGEVLSVEEGNDYHRWTVRAEEDGALFVWLETPDPGWRFTVDGRPARPSPGPGIVQGIALGEASEHEVEARYRPPGIEGGGLVSLAALAALVGCAWRRW